MSLRPYQNELVDDVKRQWQANLPVVAMVLSTGGGKTKCVSRLIMDEGVPTLVVAHRDMLVSQLSLALAQDGVFHDVIVSGKTRGLIAKAHMIALGRVFLSPQSVTRVASVDTLNRQFERHHKWLSTVELWVVDEGHHVVRDNKWGRVIERLSPHARGLLPTATPTRMDRKGLARDADGYADAMVQGPPMRWLINEGFLTDYRVVCADSHMRDYLGSVAASGDWSPQKLAEASRQSQIVGDVVDSYFKYAEGKIGLTFAADLETARGMALRYAAAGVPAEVLSGETPPDVRAAMIGRLERRELKQICAVDVISEGTDIPAIEVVTFGRPTKSLGLWMQQFGRALRPAPGKTEAIAIDHVGNFLDPGLGPPDRPRVWSLARRSAKEKKEDDAIAYRVCLNPTCGNPYEAFRKACPRCGTPVPAPTARGGPEQVAGELSFLDQSILDQLRQDLAVLAMSPNEIRALHRHQGKVIAGGRANSHQRRLWALNKLQQTMEIWGGLQKAQGLDDAEMQRLFWMKFGLTVLHARSLTEKEAAALDDRILQSIHVATGRGSGGDTAVAEQRGGLERRAG